MLASIAIWAPRRLAVKAGALACAFAVHAGGLCRHARSAQPAQAGRLGMVAGPGRRGHGPGSSQMREGDSIYLWLQLDGVGRAARLRAALEPAAWPSSCRRRCEQAQRSGNRRAHAAAVRADPGRPRPTLLRPAAAGPAAQGGAAPAGTDRTPAGQRRLSRPTPAASGRTPPALAPPAPAPPAGRRGA